MAEQSDKNGNGVRESEYRIEDYFFDGTLPDEVDYIFQKTEHDSGDALEALRTIFIQNLLAAFLTASGMTVFAHRAAYETGYMTMFGISLTTTFSAANSEERIRKAAEEVRKDISESEWGKKLEEVAESTAKEYLAAFIANDAGRQVASQIVNQCAVLVWSSFEILASDVFVSVLNRKPNLAAELLNAENTKKYYREKELASSLVEYNYDLSRHMGDALIQQRRLDDLLAIKNVYGVLADKSDALRAILSDRLLWRLHKTRNLIVHRASVVDAIFQRETGSAVAIGTKLRVTPSELKDYIIFVGHAGGELVKAAMSTVGDKPSAEPAITEAV